MTGAIPSHVFGIVGWSGSGKTTLLVGLLQVLTGRGLRVSTVKHAHRGFDVDRPGKDSFRHREAGASEVMIGSSTRWALIHELRGEAELDLSGLLARMSPVDLILVEGFRHMALSKLEVTRPALGLSLLARTDQNVLAVASDEPIADLRVPLLDLNDITRIADFVCDWRRQNA